LHDGLRRAYEAGDTAAANEIAALLDTMAPESPSVAAQDEGPSYLERMKGYGTEAVSGAQEALERPWLDQQARGVIAAGATGLGSAFGDTILSAADAVLPEDFTSEVKHAAQAIGQSRPVQAISEAWGDFETERPELARDVAETGVISTLASPKIPTPSKGLLRGQKGKAAAVSKEGRRAEVAKMLEPNRGGSPADRRKWSTEGRTKTTKYNPDEAEKRMYQRVAEIPGVKPAYNVTDNYNAIYDQIGVLADDLQVKLRPLDGIPSSEVIGQLETLVKGIKENPDYLVMSGNAVAPAKAAFVKARALLKEATDEFGDVNPADLLQVRRDLDKWLTTASPNIFDGSATGATKAVRDVRNMINEIIDSTSPNDVHGALQHQSDLFKALDIMGPRADAEARSVLGRVLGEVDEATGVKSPTTPLALAATGAPAVRNPGIVGGVLAAGGATLAALKAGSKSARLKVVNALSRLEEIILKGGQGAAQARADKAILISLLNDTEDTEETQ
jgi:hypothetical protein